MAFFKINQLAGSTGNLARTLTYQEFPNRFVIKPDQTNPQSKVWDLRHRNTFAIGCMTYVGPTAGKRFYFCTLLMVVKGPRSFDDIKTVDNETVKPFMKPVFDEDYWKMTENGSYASRMPLMFKQVPSFTTLLLFCSPTQPNILWLHFQDKICDDLHHKLS